MKLHQLSHRKSPLPCNKHSNKRRNQDHPAEEEDPDHLAEGEDQDHLAEEEDLGLLEEGNPRPHNNQYHLCQTSKQWEVSHKYSTETDPKLTISLKKSKAISVSMLTSLDTTHHIRR